MRSARGPTLLPQYAASAGAEQVGGTPAVRRPRRSERMTGGLRRAAQAGDGAAERVASVSPEVGPGKRPTGSREGRRGRGGKPTTREREWPPGGQRRCVHERRADADGMAAASHQPRAGARQRGSTHELATRGRLRRTERWWPAAHAGRGAADWMVGCEAPARGGEAAVGVAVDSRPRGGGVGRRWGSSEVSARGPQGLTGGQRRATSAGVGQLSGAPGMSRQRFGGYRRRRNRGEPPTQRGARQTEWQARGARPG